jgi:hypothetical protein
MLPLNRNIPALGLAAEALCCWSKLSAFAAASGHSIE